MINKVTSPMNELSLWLFFFIMRSSSQPLLCGFVHQHYHQKSYHYHFSWSLLIQTHSASISQLYIYTTPIAAIIDKIIISTEISMIAIFFLPFSFRGWNIVDIAKTHMVIVTKIHNIGRYWYAIAIWVYFLYLKALFSWSQNSVK